MSGLYIAKWDYQALRGSGRYHPQGLLSCRNTEGAPAGLERDMM